MASNIIIWDLAGFNLSMRSKYRDLYELERDIGLLLGSSNFSELDSLDWFLVNKKTNQLSFLLLSIPAIVYKEDTRNYVDFCALHSINLSHCINSFISDVSMQDIATYSPKYNRLIASSNPSLIYYKVFILDDLYFLLDKDMTYRGFLLNNATHHIIETNQSLDENMFNILLLKMFDFCNDTIYDMMEKKDKDYLMALNQLEIDCIKYQQIDPRLENILTFIKNLKFTFYDIDMS